MESLTLLWLLLERYFPIHVAAKNNHGHIVRRLLEAGANVDAVECEWGYTPLVLALMVGSEWAAHELISRGASLSYRTRNQRTALGVAAERGFSSVIEVVLKAGLADVNEVASLPFELRLLHVAAFYSQPQCVATLLRLGADPDITELEVQSQALALSL